MSVYTDVTAETIALAVASEAGVQAEEGRLASLFDAHHLRLYKLARRMSGSADAARDLVQETFLRTAGAIQSVPVGAHAEEAWLVRVLLNICRGRSGARCRFTPAVSSSAPVRDTWRDANYLGLQFRFQSLR